MNIEQYGKWTREEVKEHLEIIYKDETHINNVVIQSKQLLLGMLLKLPTEIMSNLKKVDSILDWGCGVGSGTRTIGRFLNTKVSGLDISENAIKKAKELYPKYKFTSKTLNEKYDVIINSNCLEHFTNPSKVFESHLKYCNKYYIILAPYKGRIVDEISDHMATLDENTFPKETEDFKRIYFDKFVIFPGWKSDEKQMLMIYERKDKTRKQRVGFLSYWGFPRGQSYVTKCYAKMLKDTYDIFILKQGDNIISDEFKVDYIHITEYPKYIVNSNDFKEWILKNKIDIIVFNEYKQWTNEPENLVQIAKNLGVKTLGYLVWEKFKRYEDYDRLLAPTRSYESFFRSKKIRNFSYVPYSIDFTEFPKKEKQKNDKFTFFHPGGFGGFLDRKNTMLVIEAFESLPDVENAKLIITSQKPLQFSREIHPNIEIINKEVSRQELIDLYYKADATVLPSKWETVGLPLLESLSSGTPVITMDAPPMNEFIEEGKTGFLCECDMINYTEIYIDVADTDGLELKTKMENIMSNEMIHKLLCKNARIVAEEKYDLEKNKRYFLEMLRK